MIQGQVIRNYSVVRLLGRGGQGEVYLATDTLLKRSVAIKFSTGTKGITDRLLEEARSASQLDHPNIAHIYEAGVADDGRLFVVMEYVEGESLAQALRRGPLPVAQAREVLGQVLDGLSEAHRLGIVHRDIKPSNIMLTGRGGVKLLDFGLAKQTSQRLAAGELASTETVTNSTPSGIVVGTPPYLAPEQLRGEPVDGRVDLFACGVVLYECVAGHRPFRGEKLQLLSAILHETPAPLTDSPDLSPVVQRALAKKPDDRFQTAAEMAAAIRTPSLAVRGDVAPVGMITPWRIFAASACLVLLLAGLWITSPEATSPKPGAVLWYQRGLEALRDGTYYNAARALEKLTETDPGFVLGHARLAEAWSELDAPEKAQREMLLAKRGPNGWRRRAASVELTVAAIESLVLREFAGAVQSYQRLLDQTPAASQAGVWLDLGRAQEKLNDNNAARKSYTQAIERDPDHAAGWLLRGVLNGRSQMFPEMTADFQKAQAIYEASQNFEGQAELAYQQGRIATLNKDLAAGRAALERALDLAGKTGGQFHQIRALTQLSIVTYMEGNAAGAQEISTRAVARAREARMPYLTVHSLVDLGNAQLSRLDLKSAEPIMREAVALAHADRLPRSEARARVSLGSVLVQAIRDEEAIPEINAALSYYSTARARSEINFCRALLGRVHRRRGEFAEVQRILEETLRDAETSGDKGKVSDAVGEIANLHVAEEKFVDALRQFERRLELVKESKAVADIVFSLTGKAAMLLRLGSFEQAGATLDEAERRAGTHEGMSWRVKALRREALYRSGQWAACAAAYADALREKHPNAEEEVLATAHHIECLAFGGRTAEARRLAGAALERTREMKGSQAAAWLSVAAVLVEPPSKTAARMTAALEYFRKREQYESLWMAETALAASLRRSGDVAGAAWHSLKSEEAWVSLQARLGVDYRQTYQSSQSVRQYRAMEAG